MNNVTVQSNYRDIDPAKGRIVGVQGYLYSDGELRSVSFLVAPRMGKVPPVAQLNSTTTKLPCVPSSYKNQLGSYEYFEFTLNKTFTSKGNVFVKSITGKYNRKNLKAMDVCFSNGITEVFESFGSVSKDDTEIFTKTVFLESAISSVELMSINTQLSSDGPVNAGFALVNFGVNRSTDFRVGPSDSEVPEASAKRDKFALQIDPEK